MAQLAKPTQSPTRWREASTPRRMRHSIVIALHSGRSSVDGSADSGIAADYYVAGPPSDGYPNDIAARERRRSVIWTRHPSVDHVRRASSYLEYDGSVSSCYATRRDRTIGCVYGDNEPGERPWRARRIGRVALDRAYWVGCRPHRDGDPRRRLRRHCVGERHGCTQGEQDVANRSHEPTVDDQYHENVNRRSATPEPPSVPRCIGALGRAPLNFGCRPRSQSFGAFLGAAILRRPPGGG